MSGHDADNTRAEAPTEMSKNVSSEAATETGDTGSQHAQPLVEVEDLKKHFPISSGMFSRVSGYVKAVDGVNFSISSGETLGLVGESGCGKTTLGRCLLRAIEPTSGRIALRLSDGKLLDFTGLDRKSLRKTRPHVQMIFQDPYSSLDPRMTVLDIVGEPLVRNGLAKGRVLEDKVKDLVQTVGLDVKHIKRYPHAFSGGQRQRIGIARALAPSPQFIVCDEPVSALDVSIQAQVLNLMEKLQSEFHLTYLFISHDLSVVEHISNRVGVMYVGKLVELASSEDLYLKPKHPYTEALMSALPKVSADEPEEKIILKGEVASPANPPTGCYFHPRCPYVQEKCRTEEPPLRDLGGGQFAACHFAEELDLTGVER